MQRMGTHPLASQAADPKPPKLLDRMRGIKGKAKIKTIDLQAGFTA